MSPAIEQIRETTRRQLQLVETNMQTINELMDVAKKAGLDTSNHKLRIKSMEKKRDTLIQALGL